MWYLFLLRNKSDQTCLSFRTLDQAEHAVESKLVKDIVKQNNYKRWRISYCGPEPTNDKDIEEGNF